MARAPFLRIYALFFLLLICAIAVEAQQDKNDTKTKKENRKLVRVGWKAQPVGRGTLALLINCMITLFLCVWTTVHVNIEPEPLRNKSFSRWFPSLEDRRIDRWLAKRQIRKAGWSLVALVLPELAVIVAMFEHRTARLLQKKMHALKEGKPDYEKWKARWDLSLAYFVIMGGFRVVVWKKDPVGQQLEKPADHTLQEDQGGEQGSAFKKLDASQSQSAPPSSPPEVPEPTVDREMIPDVQQTDSAASRATASTEKSKFEMQPQVTASTFQYQNDLEGVPQDPNIELENETGYTLTPHGVLYLASQEGGFRNSLTPEQVKDRSKAGTLAKVIVVAQASWMGIQVLTRTAAGLTVTLLEVHVMMHVFCSLCMFIVWWGKPVDIDVQEQVPISEAQFELLKKGPVREPNPTNPFYVEKTGTNPTTGSQNNNTNASVGDKISTNASHVDVEAQPQYDSRQTDGYLITRSGLGKLFYIQLCDKTSIRREYFSIISRAFQRLIDAKRQIWIEGVAIVVIALIYGGAHLSTWNNVFLTKYELWMWRSSAILTAASMGLSTIALSIGSFLKKHRQAKREFGWFIGFMFGLGIIPVIVARFYLFVECFVTLRRVPADSYDTVVWAETWPHFN